MNFSDFYDLFKDVSYSSYTWPCKGISLGPE